MLYINELVKTVNALELLILTLVAVPVDLIPAAKANGSPPTIVSDAVKAILVLPSISPVIVTQRPILVYLPLDEKVPTTTTEEPIVGVQVPSS